MTMEAAFHHTATRAAVMRETMALKAAAQLAARLASREVVSSRNAHRDLALSRGSAPSHLFSDLFLLAITTTQRPH